MKKSLFIWFLAFPVATLFGAPAVAQHNRAAHGQMAVASVTASQTVFEKILDEYYRIHDSLANDTTNGVDAAALKIAKLAASVPQKSRGANPDFAAINRAAVALQGKSLEPARQQFFELSKAIIAELKRNSSVRKSAFAYKCTMANKTWVQGSKEVRNPYYGKSMPKCGEPL